MHDNAADLLARLVAIPSVASVEASADILFGAAVQFCGHSAGAARSTRPLGQAPLPG